jgi:hypothetical protein
MSEEDARLSPGSLRKLVQASRTWDAVSRREMRAGLRAAASRGADDAKSQVLGPPPGRATGPRRSTGLRTGLAAGVKVSIRTGREAKDGNVTGEGVRVTTTSTRLDSEKAPMVKAYMARSFRHPVFGRSVYVDQPGKDWFYGPLRAGRDEYQKAIVDAVNKAAEAIARD